MSKIILIDTNILVYAINSSSPKHRASQEYLKANAANAVVTHQNVMEALRVLTHRKFQNPMSAKDAQRAVDAIVKHVRVITPSYTAYELAKMLILEQQLRGNAIFDAYLAATALASGVNVIATDIVKDFRGYEKLKVVDPFSQWVDAVILIALTSYRALA